MVNKKNNKPDYDKIQWKDIKLYRLEESSLYPSYLSLHCNFFNLIFPLILVSLPTPLFLIRNQDLISHDDIIEIFDEKNISLLKETYLMDDKQSAGLYREIQWLLRISQTFITGSDDMYTFNINVDYDYTKEITIDINQYETIDVKGFAMDYPKVLIPIRISIITM